MSEAREPHSVRFTPEERRAIVEAAKRAGVGWTTWVREAAVRAARRQLRTA